MEILEIIVVVVFFVGITILGVSQWHKSRHLQTVYRGLSEEQKTELDKAAHN